MRLARLTRKDGKRHAAYDRGEAPISSELPAAPAAVLLYDGPDRASARIRALAFDLDAKKHIDGAPAGRDATERDVEALVAAVEAAGGRCIVDSGPTGGWHVWVPLAEPLPLCRAAALGHALARVFPTLDIAPLSNAATGCLRPPGSPHAAGGFQALHTPLADALRILDEPSPPRVVEALWSLAVPVAGSSEQQASPTTPVEQRRALPRKWELLAANGPAPGEFGGDASGVRWHITLAAVRSGWTAEEWVAAIGAWPWLAAQLCSPRRLQLAHREFVKARASWLANLPVQLPDTSPNLLHGGGGGISHESTREPLPDDIHHELRKVRSWLASTARSGSMTPRTHAVARAVLLFAHATGCARIQVGVRALAICAAVSRTTAAAALWELDDAGMVSRVGRGIGRGADVWEINLELGCGLPPAPGTIWATRPVFRVVGGHGAAEVYEALATATAPQSSRQLAGKLGRSSTTVTGYLNELASWGLAAGGGRDGWRIGPADPDELAHRLGALDLASAQVAQFRAERLAWWEWLESRGLDPVSRGAPGAGQIVLMPDIPEQRHAPAARGDRAGPQWSVAAAISTVRAVLGGVVVLG